jgi:ribosomal protein S18 acetylase RimI-like enzyme
MEIRSLGHRTDLFFPRFEGEIIDRGDYLVILTRSNPTFYWGNYLIFDRPPAEGDYDRWRALFGQEVYSQVQAQHMTFAWDTVDGETGLVQPFLDAGFRLSQTVVLTAREVHLPPKCNAEVVVRPLRDEHEWLQSLDVQVACGAPDFTGESYRTFKIRQQQRYRKMIAAGLGEWFGAFLGDQMVADLGLFHAGPIGRFQQVGTHPDFRRRGICGRLVYEAARYGLERMGIETLVMLADENYHAARIYESVGFVPTEHTVGIELRPAGD